MYQRSIIEISKSAFDSNISFYKKKINNQTLAAVVKANAYGHGLKEIATLCQKNNLVDWLCVAYLSEALYLRKLGITKPILVLVCIDDLPELLIKNKIAIIGHSKKQIDTLQAVAQQLDIPVNVHLKIDTGLSRLGVLEKDALSFIQYVQNLSHIRIQGILTHFAEPEKFDSHFTQKQLNLYKNLIKKGKLQNKVPYIHIGSSASMNQKEIVPFGNFFRIGAGIYGLTPNETLQPVLTWKTKIISIKTVAAGATVSYGRTYKATKKTKLAVLPIGYSENYNRRLSNKGFVYIKKQPAPIVGVIGMNMTIVDVSEIKNICLQDEVILIGNYENITAKCLAKITQSFNPREVTTRINSTIKKVIVP